MASAADYSYLECSASSYNNKSNSSELYETCGGGSHRSNMGVLVTGPWPMSHEPIYDRPSSGVSVPLASSCSRRSMRENSKDCLNCHHHQSEHYHQHRPQSHHHNSIHHQQQHSHHNQSLRHIHNNSEIVSLRNNRPFSVPPAMGLMSSGSHHSCRSSTGDANHMEMLPLGSNSLHPGVPSRATLNEFHPASPPTCVPWLRKMKVIKKLQRKIGLG